MKNIKGESKVGAFNRIDSDDALFLRVAENRKTKEWYEFHRDRIIPAHTTSLIDDYEELDRLYRFMGNDISGFKKEIEYYCGDLSAYDVDEDTLVTYNPVISKFAVLYGDLLVRNNTSKYMPSMVGTNVKTKRDQEFREMVVKMIEEELQLAVLEQTLINEGANPQDAAAQVEQMRQQSIPADLDRATFISQAEHTFSKLIQWSILDQEVVDKSLETLEDALISARMFLYVGWRNGKPVIEIVNPKFFSFHKNPNEKKVEKGDYAYYRDEITLVDALQEYMNKLDDEDLTKLLSYGGEPSTVNRADHIKGPAFDHVKYYSTLSMLGERLNKGSGLHQGSQTTNYDLQRTLWRIHCEFKAFQEVIFLTRVNEYGETKTIQVDSESFVIPEEASKVSFVNKYMVDSTKYVWVNPLTGLEEEAEIMWVPRRYEFTMLEHDILVEWRQVPFQPDYTDNPFSDFELSYKGRLLFNRNTKWLSPLQRVIPTVFQYMIVKRLQDREMANFIGSELAIDVDQIPDQLGDDNMTGNEAMDDPLTRNEIIARRLKRRFYSGSRTTRGLPPPTTRSAGVAYNIIDSSPMLQNLQNLANMLSSEIGIGLGIPPQREAITIPGTNVSDNRQALSQATLSTQSIFYHLDRLWVSALNEHIYNVLTYIDRSSSGDPYPLEYVLPDRSKAMFLVMPDDIEFMRQLGLYTAGDGKDEVYYNVMMQQIFSFAQNGGQGALAVSAVLKSLVKSASPEEVHAMITNELLKQEKRQAEQNQALAEIEKRRSEEQLAAKQLEIDAKLYAVDQSVAVKTQELQNRQQETDMKAREVEAAIQHKANELSVEQEENEKDRDLQRELNKNKRNDS